MNRFPYFPRARQLRINTVAWRVLAAAFLLIGSPGVVWSEEFHDDNTPSLEKAANDEITWQLPAPPVPENLLKFYISLATGQTFFIDATSLTVDTDGVIRYTMIGISSVGAKNISYEGIRCHSFEKKLYALGHGDGSWTRARRVEWETIPVKGANLQQATLAEEFFCKGNLISGGAKKILSDIRYRRIQPG